MITLRQAPPGGYVVKVRGGAPNYYTLRVILVPRPLAPDGFENNNTRATAAEVRLRAATKFDLFGAGVFYQGGYDANIQDPTTSTGITSPISATAHCVIPAAS